MNRWSYLYLLPMLLLAGCTKPPADESEPMVDPAVEAAAAAAITGASDDATWRREFGNADAPVVVECFFPMNEDHAWVIDLNQAIADAFGDQVKVVQIDWFHEEGGKLHSDAGLPACSVYRLGEEILVQKSQELGGWTADGLIAMIAEKTGLAAPTVDAAATEPTATDDEAEADATTE